MKVRRPNMDRPPYVLFGGLLFVCLFVCCVRPSDRPSVLPFLCLFVCFFVCLFAYLAQRVQVPSKEVLRPLFPPQKPSSGGTWTLWVAQEVANSTFSQCSSYGSGQNDRPLAGLFEAAPWEEQLRRCRELTCVGRNLGPLKETTRWMFVYWFLIFVSIAPASLGGNIQTTNSRKAKLGDPYPLVHDGTSGAL